MTVEESEAVVPPRLAAGSKNPPAAGKKPARPDFTARDAKLAKLKEKVSEYDAEAKRKAVEIESLVNETRANNKLEALKRTLANTVHARAQLEKLKGNTQKRMDDLQNPKNASNKNLNKGIDLSLSVEDIMERMEQLKEKVVVEQDTAERERIITRIQALNSAWMELTGEKEAAAGSDTKASGKDLASSLNDDLAKYTTQLKEIQTQEDAQRDEVEDMREKMNASQPVIDRLRQEREVCLTVVRSLWDKIKAINEEYSGLFDSYKEDLKEWNAKMDVIMAERRAEREAEMKARDEERAQRELETKGAPFSMEMMRCDQLASWCKQYEKSAVKEEAPRANVTAELDGMVALKKNTIEGEDDVFATSRSKNKKKSSKAARKANGTAETRSDNSKVALDMETLGMLSKLKLPVPVTVSDVPALVEKIVAKKAEYEDKQKRALAGEKVVEEEEEQAASSSKGDAPAPASSSSGPVAVSMRCDEAFGQVILAIAVN